MYLPDSDVDKIFKILRDIQIEDHKPLHRRNRIFNMASKAQVILIKAQKKNKNLLFK